MGGPVVKRNITSIVLCLILILSSLVVLDFKFGIVELVEGDTFYVNTTGDGGAFTSIQDAINASGDGDTVFVYSGIYYENVLVNRSINLTGEDSDSTKIEGDETGHVVQITSNWVNMTSFTITGSEYDHAGIRLINVRNCRIVKSNLTNTRYGIYLDSSDECSIENNDCSNSSVVLHSSFNNRILSNICLRLWLETSSNNNLLKDNVITSYFSIIHNSINNRLYCNKMINCSLFIYGYIETYTTQEIPPNNTVNNKPLYYYKNVNMNNDSVPLDAGQVILGNVSWAKIENLFLSNGKVGIELGYSSDNYIANNTCIYNYYGIYLKQDCNRNTIINNSIQFNEEIGLYIAISNNNTVMNNNCSSNEGAAFYFAFADDNIFKNNMLINNHNNCAFHFQFCDSNKIENNTFINNSAGIDLLQSSNNKIFHNNFIDNNPQAFDYGTDNVWNEDYPSGGNYWSDYTGLDQYKGPSQTVPGKDGIYTILKQGWNLISVPFIQLEQNLTKVLEMIDGYFDAVQWYNTVDQGDPWKHHKVSKPYGNDLFELNETIGFWIHITNPGDTIFLYNGTLPTENQTIQLHKGWNLVGYPSLTSYNRTYGLNNLNFKSQVDAIWTYNSATQRWGELGESDFFQVGRGYYIHAEIECVWEVPL
jgi:parallel beta-helix repeat protein